MASLVNGTMVRYLDANDISSFGGGHFSDGIPPLLAVAEDRGLSAGDLVLSVIALYEIQGALARSFDFMRRGYHALTQIPWTVPIVAARLMGGDREAAVNAAGLSGATGMVLNTWLRAHRHHPLDQGRRRRTRGPARRRVRRPRGAWRIGVARRARVRLRDARKGGRDRLPIFGPSKTSDRPGLRTATLSSPTRRRSTPRPRWKPR